MLLSGQLARFALVGCIGFLVDASILMALVAGFEWHHYSARAVSFPAAVTVTWYCNRKLVFQPTAKAGQEYRRYFSLQSIGALINLSTYVFLIQAFPTFSRFPVVPLAFGATLALLFNFLGSRRFVFARRHDDGEHADSLRPSSEFTYSGLDNLEAMKAATNYNEYLLNLIRQHSSCGAVLDFGAGAGTFAIPLAREGRQVLCVEPDSALRKALKHAGLAVHAGLEDVPNESVDYIYSLNVLEHIEDDRSVLRQLHDRLRTGGRLLLYVPAFDVLFSSMDRRVGHFRRYRKRQLEELVRSVGFDPRHAHYVDSIGFLVSLLYKYGANGSGVISSRSVSLYDKYAFPVSRLVDRVFGNAFGKNVFVVAVKRPQRVSTASFS